jgi:parvulin-like peptidyl-prolyl isomerase
MRLLNMSLMVVLLTFGSYVIVYGGQNTKPSVVTVKGAVLTEAELGEEIQKIMPLEAGFHTTVSDKKMKEIRSRALDALVEKELQYQDALAKGMRLGDKELEAEIDKYRERFKEKGNFTALVANAGFSEDSFKKFVERKILSEKISRQMIDEKIKITDGMIKTYYDQNSSSYFKPEEFKASHILIRVDPSLPLEAKSELGEKAVTILKKLKAGADFAETAEKESDDMSRIKGGDLGTFHLGQTIPEFEDAVVRLKPGEISGVVETLYGFHIIKLIEKKEPHQLPFDEVSDKIRTMMIDKERTRLRQQWMDELKAKAKIIRGQEG